MAQDVALHHILDLTLDNLHVPSYLSVKKLEHNGEPIVFKGDRLAYYGSRTVWESDSRRLYLHLETPHLVLGAQAGVSLTRLEDGIMVQQGTQNPVIFWWDWETGTRLKNVKLHPWTYEDIKLKIGRRMTVKGSPHLTIELPTEVIYLRFERNWQAEVVKPKK